MFNLNSISLHHLSQPPPVRIIAAHIMFALLTQRITSRLGTSSLVRGVTRARIATTPSLLSFQTRRTFHAGTARVSFAPTAAAAAGGAISKKKTTAKKATSGAKKTTLKKKAVTKTRAKPRAKRGREVAVKKKKSIREDKKPEPTRA